MSASQRITGINLYVGFIGSGGTTDLSGDKRSFTPDLSQETTDASAGNDTARYAAATLKKYSASLTMLAKGTAGTAAMAALVEGASGTVRWGEVGTATGRPKWGMAALVSRVQVSHPYDDNVEITVDFEGQGALVYDGRTTTW